ncbi:MAG: AAA family ATPase [Chloroflexota bacterium]
MLTKLTVRNFKRFDNVEIELGSPVVFIGPNNSGKTTSLQALALWEVGLRRWIEKRKGTSPEKRPGVTINRRDLITVPVPDANLLWRNLHTRDVRHDKGRQHTQNVRIEVTVEGMTGGQAWQCGLEFDYANEESLYCRPLRLSQSPNAERMPVPAAASKVHIAFLPPMSGLAANETRLDRGAINVRLGEGRTAEVLRNLCYHIVSGGLEQELSERVLATVGANLEHPAPPNPNLAEQWARICACILDLFGARLDTPRYVPERGELEMTYREPSGARLDLSSAGRGLQQTLLLLAHLTVNPDSVLLLDEPDAHLEILRQRQIYQLLTDFAREQSSQIIAASHSEVVLNEAADRDVVIAFVGKPHRIDDRGSQVYKSLKEIGFDSYYQAEVVGWVLYVEGSTDLAIVRTLARMLKHPAYPLFERPFVHYVLNQPSKARDHFFGLREAKPDLVGFALFDHIDSVLQGAPGLREQMWTRREIENYVCTHDVLMRWASQVGEDRSGGPLFAQEWRNTMEHCIQSVTAAMATLGKGSPWAPETKVSDDFLDPLFAMFFRELRLPNLMRKSDYHMLALHLEPKEIDPEVGKVLDAVMDVANRARPTGADS